VCLCLFCQTSSAVCLFCQTSSSFSSTFPLSGLRFCVLQTVFRVFS
jgi:hypothetical protein